MIAVELSQKPRLGQKMPGQLLDWKKPAANDGSYREKPKVKLRLVAGKLYAGEQFDSNLNNYYLRARYYDQSIGRLTSMDTFLGFEKDPVTLHKYLYGNSDPINNIDPSGHISLSSIGAALNISARLVTTSVRVVGTSALRFAKSASNLGKASFIRVQYMQRVRALSKLADQMRKNGKSSEEIAKVLNKKRRALGRLFKNATDPKTQQNAFARNLKEYGDKWGPTWQYLKKQGKSWEDIIESSARPNTSIQELIRIFFRR